MQSPNEALDERTAELCKALGHPVRVGIMRLLIAQPKGCYCGDLVAAFGLAQSTISHHLKVLRDASLIIGEDEGPATCYCANQVAVTELQRLLAWG